MTDEDKVRREDALRAHDSIMERVKDNNRAAIEGANIALKGLVGVNGGAVIALLGFIATLASSEEGRSLSVQALVQPLTYFAWGVVLAIGASIAAYLTNFSYGSAGVRLLTWEHPYSQDTGGSKFWTAFGILSHIIGLGATVASAVAMMCGVYSVSLALPVVFSVAAP